MTSHPAAEQILPCVECGEQADYVKLIKLQV